MGPNAFRTGVPIDEFDGLRTPFVDLDLSPTTLLDVLRWRAAHQPDGRAYAFVENDGDEVEYVGYAELYRRVRAVSAQLQGRGVGAGERAVLLYPPGLDYVVTFLGCLRAGVVAVPAYPPRLNRPVSRLQTIVRDSEATAALTTTDILSNLERRYAHAPELKSLSWLATDEGPGGDGEVPIPEIDRGALAFLQYTSGSTSSPKGVMVTHGNLLHNLAMIYHGLGHTAESQMVSWLPPYHDMGLIAGILEPLYGGFPAVLMPPLSFLQRPVGWLRLISSLGADSSGGPNFAYDLCARRVTPEELESLDLGTWKVAFSGAEPVRHESLERFESTFAPCGFRWESFYPAYGLAEATLLVTGGTRPAAPKVLAVSQAALERDRVVCAAAKENGARMLVGCGKTLAGQEVAVVEPSSGVRLPSDRVGEIWVSGSSVADGYLGRAEETDRAFHAHVDGANGDSPGPYLRTGDLGFLLDGELFVTGRLNDLIIINGRNHYPQDIEHTVETSHEALRPGGCAAFMQEAADGNRLVVVQELERRFVRSKHLDEVIASIRGAVARHHELQAHAVVLVRTASIPKTSSGKVQRGETRDAYVEGTLATVATDVLPEAQIEPDAGDTADAAAPNEIEGSVETDRVLSALGDSLGKRGYPEPVGLDDSLEVDLGLDSVAVAQLLIELEATFEVQMDDSILADLRSVSDVVAAVHAAAREDSPSRSSAGLSGLQERLVAEIPQLGATVSEQDGRNLKVDGRWCTDFASANYLGLDLHPAVKASISEAVDEWGVHPSWTRAVASSHHYDELEDELARFIGAEHVLIFPTITLLHLGILPVLAGSDGVILLDRAAHNSIQEAAQLARTRGATLEWFDHNDADDLARRLDLHGERSQKVIAVDGVYSMSGAYPPLPELVAIARERGARVYVDDAHGLGVLGENPTPDNPYGDLGNGIVRHLGLRYDEDIVYVGGMSKSFSSMVAFVTCADKAEKRRFAMASTAVFSGPSPTASLASAMAGLKVSESAEGSAIRQRLLGLTRRLVTGARALGFDVDNNGAFPLVSVRIGAVPDVVKACNILWEDGILITPALFPAVPLDSGALRFTVTAANTEEQVELAIEALRRVRRELFSAEEPSPGSARPA